MSGKATQAEFDSESSNASDARRFVTRTLEDWDCDHIADTAILLVGELVANVVLHARTAFDVTVRLEGPRLRVEVRDADARLPARKHYSVTSTTGRGLALLDELADDWGAAPVPGGKCVWFELETNPSDGRQAAIAFDLEDLDLEDLDLDDFDAGDFDAGQTGPTDVPPVGGVEAPEAGRRSGRGIGRLRTKVLASR